jgi:mono/diheme cytochrome c family protein
VKRTVLVLAGVAALASLGLIAPADAVDAVNAALVATGKAVFQRACAPCHAAGPGIDGSPMLPGAAALATKHNGAVSPFLEERDDLTAEVIKVFVRNGSGTMPMFRKTEISDAEIVAVAAYLAAASAAAKSARH